MFYGVFMVYFLENKIEVETLHQEVTYIYESETFEGLSLIIRTSLQAMYINVSSVVVNENTESKYRATTISTLNLLNNIPYVLTAFFLGSLADHYSAVMLATFLGGFLLLLLIAQSLSLFKRSVVY